MYRIHFLIRALTVGGAQRQLVAIAKGLRAKGHVVSVSTFYTDGSLVEELTSANIPVRSLDKAGRWDIIRFLWRLCRHVRQVDADIVHSYLPTANILTGLLKPLMPETQVVWGLRTSGRDSYGGKFTQLNFRLEAWLSHLSDHIIVNSFAGFDDAVTYGFPKSKMTVVVNGIDTDHFRFEPVLRKKIRAQWRIQENEIVIGLVGRLDPIKDQATFLRAAGMLTKRKQSLRFVCVGEGKLPYVHFLHNLADRLGLSDRLIWIDRFDNLPSLYSALDILVLSSIAEGFPNVIGEAMACGVPCIVTNVGDCRHLVNDLGKVVSIRDENALAHAIDELASDLDRLDHAEIRAHVVEEFCLSKLIQRTETVFSRVMRQNSQTPS